jgi:hypothetical protein
LSRAFLGWFDLDVDSAEPTPVSTWSAHSAARTNDLDDGADAMVSFVHADVTHLSQAGVGGDFQLIVDSGCLHGMSDHDRDLLSKRSPPPQPGGTAVDRRLSPVALSDRRPSSRRRSSTGSRPRGRCCRRRMNSGGHLRRIGGAVRGPVRAAQLWLQRR